MFVGRWTDDLVVPPAVLWGGRVLVATAAVVAVVMAPSVRRPPTASTAAAPVMYDVALGKELYLQPTGSLSESDVDFLARGLSTRLGLDVVILPPVRLPAWLRDGSAVDGHQVLDWLFVSRPVGAWRYMAVVEEDIEDTWTDGIYGLANTRDGVAMVSVRHFRGDLTSGDVVRVAAARDAMIRAATHELIHTLGVRHCHAADCLMGAITDRSELSPDTTLCERCIVKARTALRRPRDRYREMLTEADGWFHRGGYDRALPLYEQVLEQPEPLSVLERAAVENRLGATLLSLEHVAEGEQHVRRALLLEPRLAPAHYNMALVHAYAGRSEQSRASLERGLQYDDDPLSRHGFAGRFHLEVLEDPMTAVRELSAYRDAGGHDPYLLSLLDSLESGPVVVFEDGERIVGRPLR